MLATVAGRRPAMVCASTFRGLNKCLNLRKSSESLRDTPGCPVMASDATQSLCPDRRRLLRCTHDDSVAPLAALKPPDLRARFAAAESRASPFLVCSFRVAHARGAILEF
jgi:hypothetical protein